MFLHFGNDIIIFIFFMATQMLWKVFPEIPSGTFVSEAEENF